MSDKNRSKHVPESFVLFGRWLRKKRLDAGVDLWQMSLKGLISCEELSRMERGVRKLSLSALVAYALIFNMKVEDLLGEYRIGEGRDLESDFKYVPYQKMSSGAA